MNPEVSDETLHAFVDNELEHAERESLLADIQADPELARRVGTVRHLRDLVKLAYAEPPMPQRATRRAPGVSAWQAAVASLVLGAGLVGGWSLRGMETAPGASATRVAALHPVSLAQAPDPNRIMLHLDSGAPERMRAALDQAERLLDAAEKEGRAMELEVIANSHGLTLLRSDRSPYAERVVRMQQRHANLYWVACGQSVARFTQEGQKVELLPAVRKAPTAIGEIVHRLQQGWTYIRV